MVIAHATELGKTSDSQPTLSSLSQELATYVYYSATLVQFFNNDLEEPTLREAIQAGSIDRLARARQSFMLGPMISKSIVTEFRKLHNMGDIYS